MGRRSGGEEGRNGVDAAEGVNGVEWERGGWGGGAEGGGCFKVAG